MSTSNGNSAKELVFKTNSEADSILVVFNNSILYASRGQYGGWIIKKPINTLENVKALWCYKREVVKVDLSELEKYAEVKKFLEKVREYGIEEPDAEEVIYHYHPVKVEVKKVHEHYTVIDIVPDDSITITAKAVRLYWLRHYSRRGNCTGALCSEKDREKLELIAKSLNIKIYEIPAGGRDFEIRAKFVVDYSQVEQYLSEKPVEETPEEAEVEEPEKPAVELPPLPEIKPKELTVELETTPAVVPAPAPERGELVKIYLLSMRLPSRYLVQDVKVESSEKINVTREVRKWEGIRNELAGKLERIRTDAEKLARRVFCHVEEYGVWIAVTDEAVEEAKKISAFVTQKLQELMSQLSQFKNVNLSRYFVKAVPVYLEPESARELLDAAIRKLSEDVSELAEKIKRAEEERNKKALARLSQDYNYRRNLLEAFKKFLESLPK
jgi:hypothetical protein